MDCQLFCFIYILVNIIFPKLIFAWNFIFLLFYEILRLMIQIVILLTPMLVAFSQVTSKTLSIDEMPTIDEDMNNSNIQCDAVKRSEDAGTDNKTTETSLPTNLNENSNNGRGDGSEFSKCTTEGRSNVITQQFSSPKENQGALRYISNCFGTNSEEVGHFGDISTESNSPDKQTTETSLPTNQNENSKYGRGDCVIQSQDDESEFSKCSTDSSLDSGLTVIHQIPSHSPENNCSIPITSVEYVSTSEEQSFERSQSFSSPNENQGTLSEISNCFRTNSEAVEHIDDISTESSSPVKQTTSNDVSDCFEDDDGVGDNDESDSESKSGIDSDSYDSSSTKSLLMKTHLYPIYERSDEDDFPENFKSPEISNQNSQLSKPNGRINSVLYESTSVLSRSLMPQNTVVPKEDSDSELQSETLHNDPSSNPSNLTEEPFDDISIRRSALVYSRDASGSLNNVKSPILFRKFHIRESSHTSSIQDSDELCSDSSDSPIPPRIPKWRRILLRCFCCCEC